MEQRKCTVVTGASSGIGREIARMLSLEGYDVVGIGRYFTESDTSFRRISLDLLDEKALGDVIREIKASGTVIGLVNAAGVAYYGLHEGICEAHIREIVRVNLEIPMILASAFLPMIRENKGFIVNISSVTAAGPSPHAAAYGATKAALSHFSDTLFTEERKHGVRVINVEPDLTETKLYRNADFTTSADEDARLVPEDVAAAVRDALSSRSGVCIRSIRLSPQKNKIERLS